MARTTGTSRFSGRSPQVEPPPDKQQDTTTPTVTQVGTYPDWWNRTDLPKNVSVHDMGQVPGNVRGKIMDRYQYLNESSGYMLKLTGQDILGRQPLPKQEDPGLLSKLLIGASNILGVDYSQSMLGGAKQTVVKIAETTIPGVATGLEWKNMSPTMKKVSVGLDVVVLGLMFGPGMVKTIRGADIREATQLARDSGAASIKYNEAIDAVKSTSQKPRGVDYTGALANLEDATRASVKADIAFLDKLPDLKSVNYGDLSSFENKSGFKGLTQAIKNLSKAKEDLKRAWDAVDMEGVNQSTLTKLTEAKTNYEIAIDKYGEIAQPRPITYRTPSAERLTWSPGEVEGTGLYELPKELKEIKLTYDPNTGLVSEVGKEGETPTLVYDSDLVKQVEGYLKTERNVRPSYDPSTESLTMRESKTAVATATEARPAEEAATWMDVSMEPQVKLGEGHFVISEPKIEMPVKAPAVKSSSFPGVYPIVKVITKTKTDTIPLEDLGRMTSAQIAKQYGTDIILNAVGKPIGDISTSGLTAMTPQQVVDAANKAIAQNIVQNVVQNVDKTGTNQQINNQVRNEMQNQIQSATNPALKTALSNMMGYAVNEAISQKAKASKGSRIPWLLPSKEDEGAPVLTEEQKKGAVAWKQGIMYKTIYPPYGYDNILNTREPVSGVPVHDGPKSAYESITVLNGIIPPDIHREMGIVDVSILEGGTKMKFTKKYKRGRQKVSSSPIVKGVY